MAEALAQRGHEGLGFRAFFERHYDFVWRSLRRLGVPEAQVEDGIQEVFLSLHRRRGEFRGEASERVWVYAFARRMAATMRRTEARRLRRTRALLDVQRAAEGAHVGRGPLESHVVAHRMLDGLRASDREIVILVEVEGMSGPELAKLLKVSTDAAYGRIRQARARARALLGDRASTTSERNDHAVLCAPLFPVELAGSLAAALGPPPGSMAQAWVQVSAAITKATPGLVGGALAKLGLSAWSGVASAGAVTAVGVGVLVTSLGGPAPAAVATTQTYGPSEPRQIDGHRRGPKSQAVNPAMDDSSPTGDVVRSQSSRVAAEGTTVGRLSRPAALRPAAARAVRATPPREPPGPDDAALIREHQLLEASVIAYRRGDYEQALDRLAQAQRELGEGALQRERSLLRRRAQCQIAVRTGGPGARPRCSELR